MSHDTLFVHTRSAPTLQEARKLHCLLLVHGHLHPENPTSPVLGPQLVGTYATLRGGPQEALLLFAHLPAKTKSPFACNSLLKGLLHAAHFSQALHFYHDVMVPQGLLPDNFTYPLLLRACSALRDVEQGRRIHRSIASPNPNIYTQCALVDMFAKCGSLREAREVFDGMPARDLVSWGAMICGTARSGDWRGALGLFGRMRDEGFGLDPPVAAAVIPACGRLGALGLGTGLQCCAVKSGIDGDLCVSNALVDMYCKCGRTGAARRLFRGMERRDVFSWSSLIAGCSQNGEHGDSLGLFAEMVGSGIKPSSVTIASVLPSLSKLKLIERGKEIHGYAVRNGCESDVFVASAVVDLYCKCGRIKDAEPIFGSMLEKDIGIGNSMITGYAANGHADSALDTLGRVVARGVRPDTATIVTVLPLCNRFAMLRQGKELHGYAVRSGLGSEVAVNNSLLDMYCKCGRLELGEKVFEQMKERDTVTYNTVIAAFGMHGSGDRAVSFFDRMEDAGIEPDKVTFVALLSACSHAGLVDRGLFFYNSMVDDYGVVPDMEHYSCVVDLYGRGGRLDDAWDFIRKMAVEPGVDVLGSLLGACRVHKRMDLAERISCWLFEKDLEDPGYHVLLANIYADAGRWSDARKVRAMLKGKGMAKKPGNSWVQVGGRVHSFLARDGSHPEFGKIRETIHILLFEMKNDEGNE